MPQIERFLLKERAETFDLLHRMVNPPPSTNMMDEQLVKAIQEFTSNSEPEHPDAVEIWNFCKEMLDYCVRYAWADKIVMACLDLESRFMAPPGSYAREFGNMDDAPWRQNPRA
jgi:hypothetical protein